MHPSLTGRKTFICAAATIGYTLAHAFHLVHVDPSVAYPVLGSLSLASLRHALGPSKAASNGVTKSHLPGAAVTAALLLVLSLGITLGGCKDGHLQAPSPESKPAFEGTGATIGGIAGGPGGAGI